MGQTITLRRVGGSTMLALPKTVLDILDVSANAQVDLSIEGDTVVIAKHKPRRLSLEERLAMCDFSVPMTDEEREWLDAPAVGKEII